MKKNFLVSSLISLSLLTILMVNHVTAVTLQKPLLKVNGAVLTEGDLQEALNEIMPAGVFHGGFSSEKRKSHRPEAMEKMIANELFYQEAVKKGINVEDKIETKLRKTIKRMGGETKFKMALKKAGFSEKEYKKKLRKKFLVKKFISLEIKKKAQADHKDIKKYYEKNKKKYFRPEARRVRHILIKVTPGASGKDKALKKQRAREVIDKINAGADMAIVAWDYSDDSYRVKGGDYGLVHKGRLDPDLEKEVFKLENNRLSGIIETRYGYHIVRVEEVKEPQQLSLEEVSKKIKKKLTEKKEEQIRIALVNNLRQKAQIEKKSGLDKK